MWNYIWFRILILVLCLILAFLVGISMKDNNGDKFPSMKEECRDGICPEPDDWEGDNK